jgi:hypothetical protein
MKRSGEAMRLAALVLVLLAGSFADAAAQSGRVADLAVVYGDTLLLPGPGRVVGLTSAGADTSAFLLDLPDTVSASGRREVRLLVLDPEVFPVRDQDFTGVLDRTLAWTGKAFYSCGDMPDGSSILYEIAPDSMDVLVVQKAFTAPGHRPMGLAWDGRHLWLSDRDSGRIDRFDPEVGEFTRYVDSPGFSPSGLAWDGSAMWLTDAGTGRLYRLVGSRLRWNGAIDALSFLHRGQDILLWHDGRDLWYLPAGQAVAVQVIFP